ncbi:MAG: response regulator transcription factor [Acidimicrobiia bacterium]
MTTTVLVVDDQPIVRSGLATILDAYDDLEVIGEAADGAEAVRLARSLCPDVVVMDIRMPRLDGIAATRQLAGPDIAHPSRVLILTTFDLDEYVYEALRAGASGFLLKDVTRDELAYSVRVVAGGEALLAPRVTKRLITEFLQRPQPSARRADLDALTPREHEVLLHIARGKSNSEIATAMYLGESTVKTHVGHVLMKLALRDRVQAVILAYEQGLIQAGDG